MKTEGNTILITGGATGIGLALAESFIRAGNTVIVCGRREEKLLEAKDKLPEIHTKACDISIEKECKSLVNWVEDSFSNINIVINNAGVQRMINLKKGIHELLNGENEIEVNLVAPIHLSAYFIPLLLERKEAAIINVTSGLGFIPIAAMPLYCATKAAFHSYTLSLRHQLKDTPIKVFEIIPPQVDTELGKGSVREDRVYGGISPAELAEAAMKALARNEYEILVGHANVLVKESRTNPEQAFKNMNHW
jgi:uncharacterized oxidoreductase